MLFDPANSTHLKPWLVRTLEPICDAEPGALADYILALLKHNVPEVEMKKELQSQLDEFLEKECSPFIDTLFTALRSKSFLPYTESPSAFPNKSLDNGIPIPLDALLSSPSSPDSGRKRSLENPESAARPPAKGPRISAEGQFSRYSNGGAGPSTGGWSNIRGSPNGMSPAANAPVRMNGQPVYQPPDQRRICRDYYNLGFCSRGALCKFSHGEDALVPDQLYMNGGMPFMPMFGNAMGTAGPGAAYDPREAMMDMRVMGNGRGQGRPAVLPRMPQEEGSSKVVHSSNISGELPVIQDLTPEVPHTDVTPNPSTHSSHSTSAPSAVPSPIAHPLPNHPGPSYIPSPMPVPIPLNLLQDVDVEMASPVPSPMGGWRGGRGGIRGGAPRGRQPGAFNGDSATFRPEKRKDKTLVLEKIPEDKLSLSQVNDWFQRFGTVTNVAIDQVQKKALISFSTHEEAHAAWKSEDAVFSNRFVKVFWHRPMEGHGEAGRRALAASAPLLTTKPTANEGSPTPPTETTAPTRKSSVSSTAAALAARQQLLEQQIAEQKSLMTSLSTASSADEKKKIMDRFKQLDEEMKAAALAIPAKAPVADDKVKKERERLDKELDLHGTDAVNGKAERESGETTEDLKAKLERLKAEAASLGISDDPHSTSYPGNTHRGGYRGRARGGARGSYFRGGPRGGSPRISMSLDNRPKKLLIKGASSDHEQALRDWYETTGQMDSVSKSDSGDMVVSFRTRPAAEQGLAKGTSIPMIGSVQISWFTGTLSSISSKSDTTASAGGGQRPILSERSSKRHSIEPEPEQSLPDPVEDVEDVVARGWGREDDGMGM